MCTLFYRLLGGVKSSFVYNYCEDDGSVTPNSALQVTHLTPVSVRYRLTHVQHVYLLNCVCCNSTGHIVMSVWYHQGALRQLLLRFCEAAANLCHLRKFIDEVLSSSGGKGGSYVACQTYQAYAGCLHDYLKVCTCCSVCQVLLCTVCEALVNKL